MAKKPVVIFYISDAPKPAKSLTSLVSIKAAIPFTVKAGETVKMNMGVSCDHATVLVPGRLSPVDESVVAPNQAYHLSLKNTSNEDQMFDIGETVFYAYPLISPDYEIS